MDNWVAHTRKATVPFNLNYSAKVILITDLTNSRVLHLLISNTTIYHYMDTIWTLYEHM